MKRLRTFGALATAAALAMAACGDDDAALPVGATPQADAPAPSVSTDATSTVPLAVIDPGDGGNYAPELDPADFVERINHPLLPFVPGSRWVYESIDGAERVEVEVLEETREILGITATVVHDRVWEDGELVEDTFDWYAQDRDGTVWYLGEDSKEFENGEVVSTAGSWEAGVDGALPGILMRANPAVGEVYRQEFYVNEAEDMAQVLQLDGTAAVAFGSFDGLLVTQEWTPLEPDVIENKAYAPGIGLVLEEKVAGGEGRTELIEFEPGS